MTLSLSRRHMLGALGATGLASAFGPSIALARSNSEARLVFVVLRGGMDGLTAVPPYGDRDYDRQRDGLALSKPGRGKGAALDLDGTFGLHPHLATVHELYGKGEAVVFHAVATPYRERSHFDAQDILENGTASKATRTGWLNRALAVDGGEGVALGATVPVVLQGPAKVSSWQPSRMPEVGADTMSRLDQLFALDPVLGPAFESGQEAAMLAGDTGMDGGRRAGRGKQFAQSAKTAATFLSEAGGPNIAVLELGGWDSHANQRRKGGDTRFDNLYKELDAGIVALRDGLGPRWKDTVVIAATEFGRTVPTNGTNGTDHGTAGAAFMLGGAVNGGRVVADWPGLSGRALYEGRDLRPTTDIRSVFKAAMHDHLGIARGALNAEVFPDAAGVPIQRDLVRA